MTLHGAVPSHSLNHRVEIDGALDRMLCESPWPLEYDLISGLIGVGIYTLARLPRPSARVCLERVIGHLGGFPARNGENWVETPGLLEGAVGVGLALLAASTVVEPAWDQMLLASSALDDAVVDRVWSR